MYSEPKFRSDVVVSDSRDPKGKKLVILKDPVSHTFYRMSESEFELIRRLDGTVSVEELLERLKASGRYYSPEKANAVVDKAAKSGLILGTKYSTASHQLSMKQSKEQAKKVKRFSSILRVMRFVRPTLAPGTSTTSSMYAPTSPPTVKLGALRRIPALLSCN